MTATVDVQTPESWLEANQRLLIAEVATVRDLLLGKDSDVDLAATGVTTALDEVCTCFGLSSFERRIVLLCAAPELDGRFVDTIAAANGAADRTSPTFGLALAAFPDAHWSALGPWGPLRRWRLVEPGPGPLTTAALRIDEWLLHLLAGAGGLDERLAALVRPLGSSAPVPASGRAAVEGLAHAWLRSAPGPGAPALLRGPTPEGNRAAFAGACEGLGWSGWVVQAADLPGKAADCEELVRLWEREAMVHQAALLIEAYDADEPALREALARFADRISTPAAIATTQGQGGGGRPAAIVETSRPLPGEQRAAWLAALGEPAGLELSATVSEIVTQFDLDASAIEACAADVVAPDGRPIVGAADLLWAACRRAVRGGLDDLAQRLDTSSTLADLVLPPTQLAQLADIISHVRHRGLVYEDWQMSGPSRRGLGVSALFAGPSGTGKTLAAEVVAGELSLDLYRIDLSQVVSKYIGETEKNLRRIFDAGARSGAVLLFDEADALFGKRSEVRDSHDRYANVEVSYLLQAMEAYPGLAVLTTNQRTALDQAFLRRLRFVVTFPFPGPAERSAIWARAFPPATPTRDLDLVRLGQLSVAGGNIRSIALHAAFSAADEDGPVTMQHVLRAAVTELAKLERQLDEAEIRGWR